MGAKAFGYDAGAVAFVALDFAVLCGSLSLPLLLVPSVHSSLRVSQVVHGRFLVARVVGGNFRIAGRVPPGRCTRIAPRLSDSSEAFLLAWKRPGRELAVALHRIPPRFDRPNIRLVFIDVMGNGHCRTPKLGWSQIRPTGPWRIQFDLRGLIHAVHQMTLERFARVGHHLGQKRGDFLGLSRQCAELLAPIGRLQFDDLGEVLSARQAIGQVEAGIQVPLGDVDDFMVERRSAPPAASQDLSKVAIDASRASLERS